MRRNEDFVLREISQDRLLIPVGEQVLTFTGLICLNETGTFIWNQLETPKSFLELATAMCDEYEVDLQTAQKDISEFLAVLSDANAVIE
ncbi:MAG: PqqD family protein [Eubacteriales bacterium]|nr:PqqD family protein [Eubacteriales bacterium]